jgi:hypothetical protein
MVPRNFQDVEGVGLSLIPVEDQESHPHLGVVRGRGTICSIPCTWFLDYCSGWRKLELETHLAKPFALRHCSRVSIDVCVNRGPFFDDDEHLPDSEDIRVTPAPAHRLLVQ